MKRTVKKPDVRKAEIINAAEELFEKQGYTKTPVEDIIKEVGIAKGTFYYYFKTKQNILEEIVKNISSDLETHYLKIIETSDLSSIKKLQLMIRGPEKKAKIKPAIMKALHKPENRELQEQLNIKTLNVIAPLIAKVFEQGYQEGIFKKQISVENVQIILAGSQFILDSGLFDWTTKQRNVFLKSLQNLMEVMTGAEPKAFNFIVKSN